MIMIQNKKIYKKIISLLFLSISLSNFSSCSNNCIEPSIKESVVLEIQCDDYSRTDSKNPQVVKKGEQAEFHLLFNEGFAFNKASYGIFDEETQILTVDSNIGNQTVFVESINTSGFVFNVENNEEYGQFIINPMKNYYMSGEEVEIKTVSNSKEFLCYTLDLPYRNGLKNKSGTPISWDSETKLIVNSDIKLFVNYCESNKYVKYDLNGGTTYNGKSMITTDCYLYTNDDYLYFNTINLSQYAYRNGYILESLNTKDDGSGVRIGIGSRINNDLFVSNELVLFAQWIEETDISFFEYEEENSSITITQCSDNSQVIVIPRYINDKKVSKIASNSFVNNAITEKIVFSDTITEIEDFAFVNYSQTKEIIIYSSVEIISKKSFDMPQLKTVRINKNTHSIDYNYEEDNITRYKESILNLDQNKNNVIFVGHSTIRINHDLMPLKQKWGDDYNFFIYGASAGIHGSILLSSLLDIVRPQDYLIIPVWPILNLATRRSLALIQYDFDELSDVDYSLIKDFIWESFVDYRQTCSNSIGEACLLPEAINYCRWDQFGMNMEDNPTTDPDNKSAYNYTTYLNDYSGESFAWIDYVLEKTDISKDHVMLTWNPYNQNNIDDFSNFVEFENRIKSYFSQYTFFDTQLENIYPGNYFNKNDFMHLSSTGAKKRVERWLSQLPL